MSGLQTAFYIIAIIFMGVMFLLIITLLAAVFVIRAKVVSIQRQIEERVGEVVGKVGAGMARATVGKLRRPARGRRSR